MKKLFRRRTPEEDIATFRREPHAYGPLGMALINAALLPFTKNSTQAIFASIEAVTALMSVGYVHHRFKRGFAVLESEKFDNSIHESSFAGFLKGDVVPFIGSTAMTGAVQTFVSYVPAIIDRSKALETPGMVGSTAAISLGIPVVIWKAYEAERERQENPEQSVEQTDVIC